MLAGWLGEVRNIGGDRPARSSCWTIRSAQIISWLDFDAWQKFQSVLRRDSLVFATATSARAARRPRPRTHACMQRTFSTSTASSANVPTAGSDLAAPGQRGGRIPGRLAACALFEGGAQVTLDYLKAMPARPLNLAGTGV